VLEKANLTMSKKKKPREIFDITCPACGCETANQIDLKLSQGTRIEGWNYPDVRFARQHKPVNTYRCTNCHYVMFYAPDSDDNQ
jgi:ssDNA-binding Zn-finger/Zn-ribbon topoisomerase 1